MDNKKTTQPKDWREARRLRAWELKQKGWKQKDIAEALGVTPGAVSQWMARAKEGGVEALHRRPAPGPTPRLNQEQLDQLPVLLAKGAEHFGFRGDVWTRQRIAVVIKDAFGVTYTPTHVGRIVRQLGWSLQKPVERATQRDEVAIERWRSEEWEQVKKKLPRRDAPSCS